jgi:hypothetical protein
MNTILEQIDAIGDGANVVGMMGHQHGGPFLFAGERLDEGARRGSGLVVERGKGLV